MNDKRSTLRRWLWPPVFDDPEETRLARTVHPLLVSISAVVLIGIVVTSFQPGSLPALFSLGVTFVILIVSIWILRRGYRKTAIGILLSVGWVIITYRMFALGGLHSHATLAYPLFIVIAGVLGGARLCYAVASVSTLTMLVALVLEQRGVLLQPDVPPPLAHYLTAGALVAFLSAAIVQIVERSLQRAEDDRTRLAVGLEKSQRLEAVGRLAGGIAHDFNNYLFVILGGVEALAREIEKDSALVRILNDIEVATERSAALIRRLLAFSRNQPSEPRAVDPNRLVAEMSTIIDRTLGETIEFEAILGEAIGHVHVDPALLETALLNFAVNARDAMPAGGTFRLETSNIEIGSGQSADSLGVEPGRFLCVSVTDTGEGMSQATKARVFEPFFSTKAEAGGTGLGLATAYGTVQQSGGAIEVESELAQGTTFRIYLPRLDEPQAEVREPEQGRAPGGSETVLIVEDDEMVRSGMQHILGAHGYTTLEARTGIEALELIEHHDAPIDLVITDVIMPRMGGLDLARHLSESHPTLGVLFVSGYAGTASHSSELRNAVLVSKPFTASELLREVRGCLDRPRDAEAARLRG